MSEENQSSVWNLPSVIIAFGKIPLYEITDQQFPNTACENKQTIDWGTVIDWRSLREIEGNSLGNLGEGFIWHPLAFLQYASLNF